MRTSKAGARARGGGEKVGGGARPRPRDAGGRGCEGRTRNASISDRRLKPSTFRAAPRGIFELSEKQERKITFASGAPLTSPACLRYGDATRDPIDHRARQLNCPRELAPLPGPVIFGSGGHVRSANLGSACPDGKYTFVVLPSPFRALQLFLFM